MGKVRRFHGPLPSLVPRCRGTLDTFDEGRSQLRTGTIPRVLATLRNRAIGIIRHATYRSANIAAATRQLARQPNLTLDLLGIPRLLCKRPCLGH